MAKEEKYEQRGVGQWTYKLKVGAPNNILASADPEVYAAIEGERSRQCGLLELIASENFVSQAVMIAQGSIMTNKYAEGYPGHRYYGGCEFMDVVENLAIARAKKLFGAEHVNAQPHSGSQANFAVYLALASPGDTILGMSLDHGGHLTHGSPVNFSGKLYNFKSYTVNRETELIDYDEIEAVAKKHKPRIIVAGASAYPRIIDFERMRAIANSVDAYLMVDMAHIAGLVAAGEHPSPIPHAHVVTTTTHKTLRGPRGGLILCKEEYAQAIDKAVFPGTQGGPLMHVIAGKAVALGEALHPEFKRYQQQIRKNAQVLAKELQKNGIRLVSGGTDNHMVLVDLRPNSISGREAEERLEKVGLTVNKNKIPYDPLPPNETSGIRIGTPAVTSRGFDEQDMRVIAQCVSAMIKDGDRPEVIKKVREQVEELAGDRVCYIV